MQFKGKGEMSESIIICSSLYYEDVNTEPIEKNGNFYWTSRRFPRCILMNELESCPFSNDAGVWCPLKSILVREEPQE